MLPGCPALPRRSSRAASTALQPSWPRTMNNWVPRWAPANCMLPSTLRATTLPATRITNKSPNPRSKISSGATSESLHPRIVASGFVSPTQRCCQGNARWGWTDLPSTNRWLPAWSRCNASCQSMSLCLLGLMTYLRRRSAPPSPEWATAAAAPLSVRSGSGSRAPSRARRPRGAHSPDRSRAPGPAIEPHW